MSADTPLCLKLNHIFVKCNSYTPHIDPIKKTVNCRDNILRLSTEQNKNMTNFMAHCHFGATHIKLQKSCVDSANPSISLRWWQLVGLRAVILYAEVILFILIHSYKEYLTSFHVIARVYPIYDQTAPRPPKQQTVRYCILKDKNLHQMFFFLYSRLLILNSMKLNKPYQLQGGNIFLLSNKVLTSSVQTRHTQRAGKSFSLKAFSIFLCF